MGGIFKSIFSSPEPKTVVQYEPTSTTDSEDADIRARQQRANQSGYSNITTSNRGLLNQINEVPRRKNLLGE